MIHDDILFRLLPEFDPIEIPPWLESNPRGRLQIVLRAERWAYAIQSNLGEYLASILPEEYHAGYIRDHKRLIGIGFIDAPEATETDRVENGLSFGVMLYNPFSEEVIQHESITIDSERFPVVECPAQFHLNAHLTNGRCSAIMTDGSDEFFLVARHCVDTVPIGNTVNVNCPACGVAETTTLAKKGHVYIDVAVLRRSAPRCNCKFPKCKSTAFGVKGLQVRLHDSALGQHRLATIKEGIATPTSMINGARPQTFTFNIHANRNDSGAAVSSVASGNPAVLVGSYSGFVDVNTSAGTIVRRGFAQCADEAKRLFSLTPTNGIF